MKHPEEERLQKVATILEAMVCDDDSNESMADAVGCVSALFHESRGTALEYALNLVKERAKELDIKLVDFEYPEDKTVNKIISDVALRRYRPRTAYTVACDEMMEGTARPCVFSKVMSVRAETEEQAEADVLSELLNRYPTRIMKITEEDLLQKRAEFKDMTTEAETQLAMKAVTAACAKHTIEEASPSRWLLTDGTAGSPPMRGWNTRWVEVVVLAAGTLLVHGDGMDPVMFGHTYNSSAEDIVHTMACTRPDDALMIASVRTAMGRPYDVVVWEESLRCFREELSEFIAQCVATRERAVLVDPKSPHAVQERGRIEAMNGLLEKSRSGSDGDVPYLRRELDAVLDTAWGRTPQGRVISNQMLSAWAIVCRLSEVLKGR